MLRAMTRLLLKPIENKPPLSSARLMSKKAATKTPAPATQSSNVPRAQTQKTSSLAHFFKPPYKVVMGNFPEEPLYQIYKDKKLVITFDDLPADVTTIKPKR